MAENARPLADRVTDLEQTVREQQETVAALFDAVTALAGRVAEATQVEEIIRRARSGTSQS